MENGTMQVIIFDRKFKCLYRLHNIPEDWSFKQVHKAMQLSGEYKDYEAFRLADHNELCIDEYVFNGQEIKLTATNCN